MHFTLGAFHNQLQLLYPNVRGGNQQFLEQTNRTDSMWEWLTSFLGWEWNITDKIKNMSRIGYATEHDNFGLFGYYKWSDSEGGVYYRDEVSAQLLPWCEMLLGVEGVIYNYDGTVIIQRSDNSISDREMKYRDNEVTPYIEFVVRPFERLTLTAGVRYDFWGLDNHRGSKWPEFKNYRDFDNTIDLSADPSLRLSGKFALNNKHKIKIAGGNFTQLPSWEMRNEVFGNPHLTTEKASQAIIAHEWNITELISTDLQVYGTNLWDLSRQTSAEDSVSFIDDGKGRVRGVELLIRHEPSKRFFGWLSYSLSISERWDFERNRWIPFDLDQTHNIIIVANWQFGRDFNAGIRMQYTTGNPTTPVVGSIYNEHLHGFDRSLQNLMTTFLPKIYRQFNPRV